jgi:hypothetical protein
VTIDINAAFADLDREARQCHECLSAFDRERDGTTETDNGFWYCDEHAEEFAVPQQIEANAHLHHTPCDHVIRIRLVNGPRDHVAYLKGWSNQASPEAPHWVAITTPTLAHAATLEDPIDQLTALRGTTGAMVFLSLRANEQAELQAEPDGNGPMPTLHELSRMYDCMEATR